MKKWLDHERKEYLSHEIIDEILKLIAHAILQSKSKMIKEARYFALIIDETADISRKEQVSVCVRIITEDFETHEIFVGFYKTEDTKAETLFNILIDVLRRFDWDIRWLRGQCYDGAANMSGRISGLKTRVLRIERRALHIHCYAHQINLVVQESLEEVTCMRNFIGSAKEIIVFVRDSPNR